MPSRCPFISSDDAERLRAEYGTERAARGGGDGDLADREEVLGLVREAAAARAARHQQPWWKAVGEVLLLPITLPVFILSQALEELRIAMKGLIYRRRD